MLDPHAIPTTAEPGGSGSPDGAGNPGGPQGPVDSDPGESAAPTRWAAEADDVHELVDAAREGDTVAFDRLVELTHRDTFTLALRLTGDIEDARDVTQEAYLRAYRGIGNFRSDARFSTWLYRITANCASSHLGRRRRNRHSTLAQDEQVVDLRSDSDPQLQADASDLQSRLLEALDGLPPKLRAVVVLRDVYEMPHEAIAEELGISATAAKVRLHRARQKMRSRLFPELDEVDFRDV